MGLTVDKAVGTTALLSETIIGQNGQNFEVGCPRKRDAMLLNVGSVFRGVELDFHLVCVHT